MRSLLIVSLVVVGAVASVASETGYLFHLTDPHYDLGYTPGKPDWCLFRSKVGLKCCHPREIALRGSHPAGDFGDYHCDTPKSMLIEFFNGLQPLVSTYPPDTVFMTGDSADHGDFLQSRGHNLDEIDEITGFLTGIFSDITPVVGNHDVIWPFFVDQQPAPHFGSSRLTKALWSKWMKLLPADQRVNFLEGGYYTRLLQPKLRLIVMNSLYDDKNNFLIKRETDPAHQNHRVNQTLDAARIAGERVYLIAHIPPNAGEGDAVYRNKMRGLFDEYTDVIAGGFFGHTHDDSICRTAEGGVIGYIAPSIMPDRRYPSARIYEYNRTDGVILDYHQYIFNLTALNEPQIVNFEKLYSARDFFELENLSPNSWAESITRARNQTELAEKYWFAHTTGGHQPCDRNCLTAYLNGLTF